MEDLNKHYLLQYYIEMNNFGNLLEMDFHIEEPGKLKYYMPVTEKHLATPMAAHGGSICSLMDATMGVCALSKVVQEDKIVSTIEMKISFISPAFIGDKLTATANIIKQGKRLIFVEGEIRNQKGDLISVASGTFNAYPAEKAGFNSRI